MKGNATYLGSRLKHVRTAAMRKVTTYHTRDSRPLRLVIESDGI